EEGVRPGDADGCGIRLDVLLSAPAEDCPEDPRHLSRQGARCGQVRPRRPGLDHERRGLEGRQSGRGHARDKAVCGDPGPGEDLRPGQAPHGALRGGGDPVARRLTYWVVEEMVRHLSGDRADCLVLHPSMVPQNGEPRVVRDGKRWLLHRYLYYRVEGHDSDLLFVKAC